MGQTLAQMYLTCGWLEAIFFGICILFAFCIFVLGVSRNSSRRILLFASFVQFVLAAAHVIISLVQLLQAFTHSVDAGRAEAYYSDPGGNNLFIAGFVVYITNTFVQELLLMWRLYVLWDRNLRICIPPVRPIYASPTGRIDLTVLSHDVHVYGLTGWGLETAVNLSSTLGIAYRLWKAEKKTAVLTKHFNYKSSMLIIVECGALITTCTAIMFGLYSSGKPMGIVGVGVATQVAVSVV
ncbi:hypothetical protein HYDPIDRAFT_84009 [Hydnomerulius pinastri MD-312]|nr:hypothetical protein HYDPIDRAFT_84009 [Hydnomerulius pinastri MD-312]